MNRKIKPYTGHRSSLKEILWRSFLIFIWLLGVVYLCFNPDRSFAAYIPESANPGDAPVMLIDRYLPTGKEIPMIAKTVWGEARGESPTRQAAVVWTILNRVDSPMWPDTIVDVITQTGQFAGYHPGNPVTNELKDLAIDVVGRWIREKCGETDVGRVLPAEYMWFTGNGRENVFKKLGGTHWNWSLPSPYKTN